jgi:uncharacterized membrane protein YdfJ with MMPL/SSD domain
LVITETSLAEQIRVGTARLPAQGGRIDLVTSNVKPGARRLQDGEFVPTASKAGVAVRRAWSSPVVVGALVAVAVFLALVLIFRRAVRPALVLAVALPLGALTAWAATPPLVPLIERCYGALSTPSGASAHAGDDTRPKGGGTAETLRDWERSLVEIVRQRPDPHTLAFCGVLALTTPLYACLVSALIRGCTRRSE